MLTNVVTGCRLLDPAVSSKLDEIGMAWHGMSSFIWLAWHDASTEEESMKSYINSMVYQYQMYQDR